MAYRPRILVVEDEPLSQDMLVRRMASRGFRVATVADGAAALAHVAREIPDLVLLDINMPGLSGLEVLRELRKTYKSDVLPIILVTAMADSEDVIRGLDAGANDYVVKPINFAVLLARVQVHLRIKLDVSLLIEAERQRVLIAALGEACHQLAQPMTAVMMTLEGMIRHPSDNPVEMGESLRDILRWTEEVGQVIHKMQNVATLRPVPYTERMELFDGEADAARPNAPEPAQAGGALKCEIGCHMMLPDSESAKILLVEDNDLNRDMIQRRLVRRGYDVIVAVTGRDAIAKARTETPALILIDLRLPDMSGWEATELLKSDPASQNIPMIALTAHAMEGDRERAMKAGCDEYEAKPIDLPRLLEKMQMLIERQRRLNFPDAADSHAHRPPPP